MEVTLVNIQVFFSRIEMFVPPSNNKWTSVNNWIWQAKEILNTELLSAFISHTSPSPRVLFISALKVFYPEIFSNICASLAKHWIPNSKHAKWFENTTEICHDKIFSGKYQKSLTMKEKHEIIKHFGKKWKNMEHPLSNWIKNINIVAHN